MSTATTEPQQQTTPSAIVPTAAALYVGDLEPNVSEAALFEHFQPVGAIISVRICRDAITRRSLGYGYVNYANPKDAEKAIETKNCSRLNGRGLRVMPVLRDPAARKNAAGNIFIKNIAQTIDTQSLHDMFLKMGAILSCKVVVDENGKSKGYGFVHFANEKDAKAAIEVFNGKSYDDLQMYVAPFLRRNIRIQTMLSTFTNVYIKNVLPQLSEEDIKKFFAQFGAVTSAVLRKDKQGRAYAFCNFATHEQAVKAIESSHDKHVDGVADASMQLYVQRAQKKSERMYELKHRYEQSRYGGLGTSTNNLYIKNFGDFDTTALRDLFREYGDIASVHVARGESGEARGYAFVCFTSAEAASRALREMNGRILANRPLYVNVAQKKDARRNMLQMQFQRRPGGGLGGGGMFGMGQGISQQSFPAQWMAMMGPWLQRAAQAAGGNSVVPYFRPPAGTQQFQRRGGPQGGGRNNNRRNNNNSKDVPAAPAAAPVAAVRPSPKASVPPTPGQQVPPATPLLGPLSLEELQRMSLEEQQAALGERLYAVVNELYPQEAPKITGMLLEMESTELLGLLSNYSELKERVEEAREVLTQYQKSAGAS